MKLYNFIITLADFGLPYNNEEEALKDAKESANEIAAAEGYLVMEVKVEESK